MMPSRQFNTELLGLLFPEEEVFAKVDEYLQCSYLLNIRFIYSNIPLIYLHLQCRGEIITEFLYHDSIEKLMLYEVTFKIFRTGAAIWTAIVVALCR